MDLNRFYHQYTLSTNSLDLHNVQQLTSSELHFLLVSGAKAGLEGDNQ